MIPNEPLAVETAPPLQAPTDAPSAEATSSPMAPFPKTRRKPKLHFVTKPWSKPAPKDAGLYDRENITLPRAAAERIDEIAGDFSNIDVGDEERFAEWVTSSDSGSKYYPRLQRWSKTVNREGSNFVQGVPSAVGELAMRTPSIMDDDGTLKLTGQRAVNFIRAKVGLGTVKTIPLWHSGFWIHLKNPPDSALVDLYRRLTSSKITLGRVTGGLVFSNTRVFVTSMVVEFALNHMIDTSINDNTIDIRTLLDDNDIPLLIAGMAYAIYPNGFNYTTQCMAAPDECHHLIRQLADISKMTFVDISRLSDKQITHMARYMGRTMSKQQVLDYQAEFAASNEKVHELGDGTKLFLKSSKFLQYSEIGSAWVNSTIATVNSALGTEATDKERDDYVTKQSKATLLRQYQHYISRIEYGDAAVVDRPADIANLLEDFSTDPEKVEKIMNWVGDYLDDSTIAVVATTDFECPSCGRLQNDHARDDSRLRLTSELIPINPELVFFTMLAQKDQLVQRR